MLRHHRAPAWSCSNLPPTGAMAASTRALPTPKKRIPYAPGEMRTQSGRRDTERLSAARMLVECVSMVNTMPAHSQQVWRVANDEMAAYFLERGSISRTHLRLHRSKCQILPHVGITSSISNTPTTTRVDEPPQIGRGFLLGSTAVAQV